MLDPLLVGSGCVVFKILLTDEPVLPIEGDSSLQVAAFEEFPSEMAAQVGRESEMESVQASEK